MQQSFGKFAIPLVLCAAAGCQPATDEDTVAQPRPVSVFELRETNPAQVDALTGSVASWKTEDLAFEVAGRIQYVIEPETDVSGDVFEYHEMSAGDAPPDGPIARGHELARIDPTRYQLRVGSVQAQVETAQQKKKALQIDVDRVVPAQRRAAEADERYARSEVDRNKRLVESGAVTPSEFSRLEANLEKATADIAQLDATKESKQAELASMDAQIQELNQTLADAQRDVAETRLHSPYAGQVAEVHVIPGAYVNAGQRVVTVQMMDPIKIELEVSAAQSRRLQYKDRVNVRIRLRDESEITEEAIVYMIDPVADPTTRTFTITLLMKNRHLVTRPDEQLVRTRDIWRLLQETLGQTEGYFLEVNSVQEDGDGHYIWKVTNDATARAESGARVLSVKKIRVTASEFHIPFLGIWTFRGISINEGEDFDPETDLVTGPVEIPESLRDSWDGGEVLFDRRQWMVRPGDLVSVNLAAAAMPQGFYVPIEAIHTSNEGSYVFAITEAGGAAQVQRIEVVTSDGPETSKRIQSAGDDALTEGMKLVIGGVHYLVDGEPVNVSREVTVGP